MAPVRVGFFPGSTIGNFEPHEAAAFLRNAARILGANATLIVGADLIKESRCLTPPITTQPALPPGSI